MNEAAKAYDDRLFWDKVGRFALRAGRRVIEEALVLYYCLNDPDTPNRAKAVIIGALGYFILPLDAIPDLIPLAGFSDDLAVLLVVAGTVIAHVKPSHRQQAKARLASVSTEQRACGDGEPHRRASAPGRFRSETEKTRYCMDLLGLRGDPSPADIRERYREMAHRYHPDKVQHLGAEFREMAEQKLKAINEAHAYLKRRYGDA